MLLISASGINNAFSCSCAPISPMDAFTNADVVFSGTVENLWKGKNKTQIIMHTVYNKFSCNGYYFKAGNKYLVYATYNKRADNFLGKLFAPKQPSLGVYLCGGTKAIEEAGHDIQVLEAKGKVAPNNLLKEKGRDGRAAP